MFCISSTEGEDSLRYLRDDSQQVQVPLHIERVKTETVELDQCENGDDGVSRSDKKQLGSPVSATVQEGPVKKYKPIQNEQCR
jgi:hypothetical protein